LAILVVGSVAFDSLETPSGKRERVLGGAATHFALAASFFTDVRVVGVVGEDFLPEHEAVLTSKGVDTSGIEHVAGKSFHWTGSYMKDLAEAETLATYLNVFADFEPKIPQSYLDSEYLFLANIDPVLQLRVRQAMPHAKLVAGDTMNYWISAHRENLEKVMKELDVLVINGKEVLMLSDETNWVRGAKKVLSMGPKSLVVKYAEHGVAGFFSDAMLAKMELCEPAERTIFRAPATPVEDVVDPTGAGDSFAGGFYGYIASQGAANGGKLTPEAYRTAMFYGSVMGSLAVEAFGTERLQRTTRAEIDERFEQLKGISHL
jgi:sugar/nucleoside kinase (ribokinase family)